MCIPARQNWAGKSHIACSQATLCGACKAGQASLQAIWQQHPIPAGPVIIVWAHDHNTKTLGIPFHLHPLRIIEVLINTVKLKCAHRKSGLSPTSVAFSQVAAAD